MSNRPLIIVAQPHLAPLVAHLRSRYDAVPLWEETGRSRLSDARILVTAGEFRLPYELLEAMPLLGLIACFTVGYDGVDIDWACRRGIAVSNGGDANADDVADHAIGMVIAHRRRLLDGDRLLRAGEWKPDGKMLTRSLGGAVMGIVGLGKIGKAVADRAVAMRMQIRWWGPSAKPGIAWPRDEDLVSLARASDIVVVAARASAENEKLISAEVIDALGPQGLLVNVARGQLIDEDALISALRDRRLGGAALDVFAQEPTSAERWRNVPNTLLTPHTAGATDQAVGRMLKLLNANIEAFLAGQPLISPVTY
jgi:lactate dehydrogenase-like 2-hydroxyacid dehydrogenase